MNKPDAVEIRNATPSDHERVVSVMPDWWDGRDLTSLVLKVFFIHFNDTAYIAEIDDELTGFLVGFMSQSEKKTGYIHFVGVHPGFRGAGIAKSLYEKFYAACRQNGRSLVKSCTSPVNKLSIGFHRKMGFEIEPGDGMKRICVNCGSNSGARPEYMQAAYKLGELLAQRRIELVYGGAEVGLMGAVASAAMRNGGKVIGVIPESFADKVANHNLSELHIVPTMHERKKMMFDLSSGFIALPGGMGTIEEIFEVLTWAQLGFHGKPCGLVNVRGYYDKLIEFIDVAADQLFVKPQHRDMMLVSEDPANLLAQFEQYSAPAVEKWIERN